MARDGSGNYALPAGNPVAGGTVITSTWANGTMSDLANEITNSLDRNGRGGMLVPFQNVDGTVISPGITFTNEPSSGFYRAGVGDIRASVNGEDTLRIIDDSGSPVGQQRPVLFWDGQAWQVINPFDPANVNITGGTISGVDVTVNSLTFAGNLDMGGNNIVNASTIEAASTTPALILKDTDGTSTHNTSWWVQNADGISLQIRNNAGALVGTGYRANYNSSGPASHAFSIAGLPNEFWMNGTGFGIGGNPAASLHIQNSTPKIRIQDTDGTNQYSDIIQSNGGLFIGSRDNTLNGRITFRGTGGGSVSNYGLLDDNGLSLDNGANYLSGGGTWALGTNLTVQGNLKCNNFFTVDGVSVNPTIRWSESGTARADGVYDRNNNSFLIRGRENGATVSLQSLDPDGLNRNLFSGDPGGVSRMFASGIFRIEANDTGADINGALTASHVTAAGNITASGSFVGDLNGNANTATHADTATDATRVNVLDTGGNAQHRLLMSISPVSGITRARSTGGVTANAATNVIFATDFDTSSDETLKDNWQTVAPDFVKKFAAVKRCGVFHRTDTDVITVGVGAQSAQKFCPEAITVRENGNLGINSGGFATVAAHANAQAIVELREEVSKLKAELAALKGGE